MNALENNNIDEIIDIIPNTSFPDYFEALRKKYKLKKSDIIKKANIDRTYGYQIINGTRNPDKDKVICLALSMKLTLDETNHLLSLSNNEVCLLENKFNLFSSFSLFFKTVD